MSEPHSANDETGNETTRLPSLTNRRSVLRGVAALGVSSSVIGSVIAPPGDGITSGGSKPNGGDKPGGSSGASVGIQLYTLRDLSDTVPQLIRRVGSTDNNGGPGYDAVESAGLGNVSASEIHAALKETGLDVSSAHVDLGVLQGNSLNNTVETYAEFDVDTYIHPGLPNISSVQDAKDFARKFNDIAANLAQYDARVGFHNHNAVFRKIGNGRTILDVLDANLNESVIFEIDAGWVLTAGYDPAEIIRKYSERTKLVHMKDMKNGDFYELGEGALDLKTVAKAAREVANVEYLIYEYDQPENPAGSVGTGAGVLSFFDGRPGLQCLKFADIGGPDYKRHLSCGGRHPVRHDFSGSVRTTRR